MCIRDRTATTPKAIAEQCEVIITMLPNSPHVKEVALGENGIIEGAKPGTVVTVSYTHLDVYKRQPSYRFAAATFCDKRPFVCASRP